MKKTINALNTMIDKSVKDYESASDEDKLKKLKLLQEQQKARDNEVKCCKDEEIRKERLEAEKAKATFEERRFELEQEKMRLEQERFEYEKKQDTEKAAREAKESKIRFYTALVTAGVPLVLGLVKFGAYLFTTINAQRHDYADYKIESGWSKEGRNGLIK